jgi:hypothetical protein
VPPEKHHQMRGAVRADSGQSEQACRDLVVGKMVLIASKTDGVRSIWVAREGWKKGSVNPMTVVEPPDTEAIKRKSWYSRARVKQQNRSVRVGGGRAGPGMQSRLLRQALRAGAALGFGADASSSSFVAIAEIQDWLRRNAAFTLERD